MKEFIIETRALQRTFDGKPAVSGLDLRVPTGSIFGFPGRNGVGKTTAIRLLLGLLKTESGQATMFGTVIEGPDSAAALSQRIGYVSENKHLYPYMTVQQIIRFTRPFFSKCREDPERRYPEIFDLPPDRKVSALSKGCARA